MLRLYVDSASREAAEPLLATGLFHGLTTNPTLLRREGLRLADLEELYSWATAAGAREVFFQAWGAEVDELVAAAGALQDIGPRVVTKLPASKAGASAAAQLVSRGHTVLLTAVYSAAQGLLAAAAGAQYVAPYLGRMDDAERNGFEEVLTMHRTLAAAHRATEVLVASVRDVETVVALAQQGVACFALQPEVAEQLFQEPLTAAAVEVFEADARRVAS